MAARNLGRLGAVFAIAGLGAFIAGDLPSARAASSQAASQCAGVETQAQSPSFTSWPGVTQAKRITRIEYIGKAPMHRTAGVQLFVPARPGLSAEYLQRLVGCQIALAAEAAGQGGQDPLAVPGLRAEVTPRQEGYRVRLTSRDVSTAQDLVRRMGL